MKIKLLITLLALLSAPSLFAPFYRGSIWSRVDEQGQEHFVYCFGDRHSDTLHIPFVLPGANHQQFKDLFAYIKKSENPFVITETMSFLKKVRHSPSSISLLSLLGIELTYMNLTFPSLLALPTTALIAGLMISGQLLIRRTETPLCRIEQWCKRKMIPVYNAEFRYTFFELYKNPLLSTQLASKSNDKESFYYRKRLVQVLKQIVNETNLIEQEIAAFDDEEMLNEYYKKLLSKNNTHRECIKKIIDLLESSKYSPIVAIQFGNDGVVTLSVGEKQTQYVRNIKHIKVESTLQSSSSLKKIAIGLIVDSQKDLLDARILHSLHKNKNKNKRNIFICAGGYHIGENIEPHLPALGYKKIKSLGSESWNGAYLNLQQCFAEFLKDYPQVLSTKSFNPQQLRVNPLNPSITQLREEAENTIPTLISSPITIKKALTQNKKLPSYHCRKNFVKPPHTTKLLQQPLPIGVTRIVTPSKIRSIFSPHRFTSRPFKFAAVGLAGISALGAYALLKGNT